MTRYQLSITAENLPKKGPLFLTSPSPYAVVTVTGGPREGTQIGRTETLKKTTDPDWAEHFIFDTDASVFMPIRVAVYDDRGRKDALLGEGNFEAIEVFQSQGRTQYQKLPNRGNSKIYANVEESVKGPKAGMITLQIRGLDLKNIEPGPLGLGRSDPFYEIARKNVDHSAGIVRWDVIYRSEHINNHLNPFWKPLHLDMEKVCFCDSNWPLKVIIKDHEDNGKHREIGHFETTLRTLMDRVAVKGNADREMAFEIFDSNNDAPEFGVATRGLIVVLEAIFTSHRQNSIRRQQGIPPPQGSVYHRDNRPTQSF